MIIYWCKRLLVVFGWLTFNCESCGHCAYPRRFVFCPTCGCLYGLVRPRPRVDDPMAIPQPKHGPVGFGPAEFHFTGDLEMRPPPQPRTGEFQGLPLSSLFSASPFTEIAGELRRTKVGTPFTRKAAFDGKEEK